jgi:hypothetical protein
LVLIACGLLCPLLIIIGFVIQATGNQKHGENVTRAGANMGILCFVIGAIAFEHPENLLLLIPCIIISYLVFRIRKKQGGLDGNGLLRQ